ncbi:hypothetical protein QYF36_006199 [Acer negundo]|nr:hypothetical protein QYF36_006199 [Acer negundo]
MANREVLPASTTSPLLNDPSVLSSWSHRLWVAIGCTTVLISLAKSMVAATHSHIWLRPMLAGCVGYILADLFSGIDQSYNLEISLLLPFVQPAVSCVGSLPKEQVAATGGGAARRWGASLRVSTAAHHGTTETL